jgi:hypothetical protein
MVAKMYDSGFYRFFFCLIDWYRFPNRFCFIRKRFLSPCAFVIALMQPLSFQRYSTALILAVRHRFLHSSFNWIVKCWQVYIKKHCETCLGFEAWSLMIVSTFLSSNCLFLSGAFCHGRLKCFWPFWSWDWSDWEEWFGISLTHLWHCRCCSGWLAQLLQSP